jgi:proteasome accessory factor B
MKIPAEQRQLSLVLALVHTRRGFTKSELFQSVFGYEHLWREGNHNNLNRMFERDKSRLRELGVHIVEEESRYRIAKEFLQVPKGLHFSASELTVLRAAALAWHDESLSAPARLAAMKLQSLGVGTEANDLGVYPTPRLREPSAPSLAQAIADGNDVRFLYQHPDYTEPLERQVAPLKLERADGRWHLLAWDYDRSAGRVFLLSRIRGRIRVLNTRYDPQLLERLPAQQEELRNQLQTATLTVETGSAADAKLRPRALRTQQQARHTRLDVATLDPREFAQELAGFGPSVQVHGPESLMRATREVLERVSEQHRVDNGFDGGVPLASAAKQRRKKSTKLEAGERVILLLSLLAYLQESGEVTITELAKKFGVDENDMRMLVGFIGQAGVPGETGTYQHEDLMDIDWAALEEEDTVVLLQSIAVDDAPRFTATESAALLAGLNSLYTIVPEVWRDAILSASEKISQFTTTGIVGNASSEHQPELTKLAQAISERRVVRFVYSSAAGDTRERKVFPYLLTQASGDWLLEGYCFEREAERHFRLDRMHSVSLGETLQHEPARTRTTPESDNRAHTETSRVAVHETADVSAYNIDFDASAGPWLLGNVELWHRGSEFQLIAAAPGDIIILEPSDRRGAVASWAERALAAY